MARKRRPKSTKTTGGIENHCNALKRTQKSIENIAEKWARALGLGWWRKIDFIYDHAIDENAPDTGACATVRWQYREAAIRFFLPNLVNKSQDDLDYIVRHEFMHVLVKEMRWQNFEKDEAEHNVNHEERVCTELAMAFGWTREAAKRGDL